MNVIARLEYELAYDDSVVHRFNHYTTRTPPQKNRKERSNQNDLAMKEKEFKGLRKLKKEKNAENSSCDKRTWKFTKSEKKKPFKMNVSE